MPWFQRFLIRGNVIDLAVGLIMGTATAVVTSLVQAVLGCPLVSKLVKSPTDEFLVFGQIKVGVFLAAVNFILIAVAVYCSCCP